MPHLMNCPHSVDGWCLACVKELQLDQQRIDFLATMNDGWPVEEWLRRNKRADGPDICACIVEVMPDTFQTGDCVPRDKMQEAFRLMVDIAMGAA